MSSWDRPHPEVRPEGREPLPDKAGESTLLSRSGGEKIHVIVLLYSFLLHIIQSYKYIINKLLIYNLYYKYNLYCINKLLIYNLLLASVEKNLGFSKFFRLLQIVFLFLFWPRHVTSRILVPWPRIKPVFPASGVQSINHWTVKEVPK